ncbi:MAG: EF-hand domain-containing protein [Phycisphaerales bacterium]
MPARILIGAVACSTLAATAFFSAGTPLPREQAVAVIERLSQRTDLAGTVRLGAGRDGRAEQAIEFDRNGTLAAACDDPQQPFAALTDGTRTAVQASWVGTLSDPSPAVRQIDRLLDLSRLKKAAAAAEWTAATDGSLRARLDPKEFADLGAATGEPSSVKAVNATISSAEGAPTQLVLSVVRSPEGGTASAAENEAAWTTTAKFSFKDAPAQAALNARASLSERLKNAPAAEPAAPTVTVVGGTGSAEEQELIRRLTAAAGGQGGKRSVPAAETVARFIKGSDKDGDGKLSRAELGDAKFDSLKAFDANGDGLIDEQELTKALEAAVKQKAATKK